MSIKMKDINFFEQVSAKAASKGGAPTSTIVQVLEICLVAFTIIVVGVFVGLQVSNSRLSRSIETLNLQLKDGKVQEQLAELNKKSSDLTTLKKYIDAIGAATNDIESYPKLTPELFLSLAKSMPDDIEVSALTFSEDKFVLNCSASRKDSPSTFTDMLGKSPYISKVIYPGYTTATVNDTIRYQFTLTCYYKSQQLPQAATSNANGQAAQPQEEGNQ